MVDAAVAVVALLVAVALSVLKPRGITPYGQRKQREPRVAPLSAAADRAQ